MAYYIRTDCTDILRTYVRTYVRRSNPPLHDSVHAFALTFCPPCRSDPSPLLGELSSAVQVFVQTLRRTSAGSQSVCSSVLKCMCICPFPLHLCTAALGEGTFGIRLLRLQPTAPFCIPTCFVTPYVHLNLRAYVCLSPFPLIRIISSCCLERHHHPKSLLLHLIFLFAIFVSVG